MQHNALGQCKRQELTHPVHVGRRRARGSAGGAQEAAACVEQAAVVLVGSGIVVIGVGVTVPAGAVIGGK